MGSTLRFRFWMLGQFSLEASHLHVLPTSMGCASAYIVCWGCRGELTTFLLNELAINVNILKYISLLREITKIFETENLLMLQGIKTVEYFQIIKTYKRGR